MNHHMIVIPMRIGVCLATAMLAAGCSTDNRGGQQNGLTTTGGANHPASQPWRTIAVAPAAVPHLQAAPQPSEDVIVTFATASAVLGPDAQKALDRYVQGTTSGMPHSIVVEGRADVRGQDAYNKALALRRANALKAYLVSRGLSAPLINIVSYGKDRPIAACPEESCWAWNRSARIVGGAKIASRY